jgi:carboxypeptidase Taq
MTTAGLYNDYVQKMQRIADVRQAHAVLQWDQETYLPRKGAYFRGQQLSTLSEIAHGLFSEEALGGLLQDLLAKDDLTLEQARNVELSWEDYSKNKKYTPHFVRRLSDQANKTFHAWIEARRENSFSFFERDLDALIQLKREEAEVLHYEKHPYNALLNEYEKGATVAFLDQTFADLLPQLQHILLRISARPQVDDAFLKQHFPKEQQWAWGMDLLKSLGFDFERGRQDISEHPFSTSFNPHDVRVTTRIDEGDFGNMTWSCIHEAGHALYEQGLPEAQYGLPLGEACSYSIHESQSRLWENHVGRSRPFWEAYYPKLKERFPEQLRNVRLEQFYAGINNVQPSLIRTEADEITYHFHVYIRYELEKRLLEGSLKAAEIPQYWQEQYKAWMDVTVTDDRQGCLQDVHWGHGSFGYFPTYSLGSFYAAQFYAQAKKELPRLESEVAQGHTEALLGWLRRGVHAKGRIFTSAALCQHLTGAPLDVRFFISHVLEKYGVIYTL